MTIDDHHSISNSVLPFSLVEVCCINVGDKVQSI